MCICDSFMRLTMICLACAASMRPILPRHVFCNRDGWPNTDGKPSPETDLEEHDAFIVLNGVRINKPFVEKPVSGEDHNVFIYYSRSSGGGRKRLFRKIGNKSSEFDADVSTVLWSPLRGVGPKVLIRYYF